MTKFCSLWKLEVLEKFFDKGFKFENLTIKEFAKTLTPLEFGSFIKNAQLKRKEFFKDFLHSCAILSIKTGNCKGDCKFCSQSKLSKAKINPHDILNWEKVKSALSWASQNSIKHFSFVTSGIRPSKEEIKKISVLIEKAKIYFPDLKICASLGILTKEELKFLKDSGLDRYHNNLETSKRIYKYISSLPWDKKLETILNAKEIGLKVCSGGIFGLGESLKDALELLETVKDIADGVPVNFLVPIKGTPFENKSPLTLKEGLIYLSLFRLYLPYKNFIMCGGRQVVFEKENYLLSTIVSGIMFGNYLTTQGKPLSEDEILFSLYKCV
ncbi:MAG TPA: biotin synthase BioB [Desulfurobacteriaceae bacterium]|nr:biotin synthase BioB [Desulfurobacteriaceae bacterium]